RDHLRRDDHPRPARAVAHAPHGELELVVPRAGRAALPRRPRSRAGRLVLFGLELFVGEPLAEALALLALALFCLVELRLARLAALALAILVRRLAGLVPRRLSS